MITSDTALYPNGHRFPDILYSLSYRASDLSDYLKLIADGIVELLELDLAIVTLQDATTEKVLASSSEKEDRQLESLHSRLTSFLVNSGQILAIEDMPIQPGIGDPSIGYRAYLGIPLPTCRGDVNATICSLHRQPRQFRKAELQLVEMFAGRAAVALDNDYLHEREYLFRQRLQTEAALRTFA